MPVETLDEWEEAARKEVECQAFIDASMGPQEFYGPWSGHKDQHHDKQGKWKRGIPYQKAKKDPDTMEVDVTHLQSVGEKDAREKQHQEGCCYTCNKQGHLKRDCPQNGRKGVASPYSSSVVKATHIQEKEVGKENVQSPNKEELIAQLRGLGWDERDEVVDALIS
jgi:hypothetical protein